MVDNYNVVGLVNEKAVATDEVYYATEQGQIFDCDYKNMRMFRKGTLYSLLEQVPSTIGRMSRPNNIVDRYRARNRGYSITGKSGNARAEGSMNDDSVLSDNAAAIRFKRRGTVNLVKNFMVSKIQKVQQSGFMDGSSMQGDAAHLNDASNLRFGMRSRINNMSVGGAGGLRDRSSLGAADIRNGALSPGNLTSAAGHGGAGNGGHFQFDKTGAPVNILMAPEEEEGDDIL